MFSLVCWVVFGLVVGSVSKWFFPIDDRGYGMLSTLAVGVVGSFAGGFFGYLLDGGSSSYSPAGFLLSIVGGVACCAALRWYSSQE